MKRLWIPLAILAAAAGGLYWLVFGFWFGRNQQDKDRAEHLFGWTDPARDVDYASIAAARGVHEHFEALKNLSSEWNRSDPQRGAKLMLAGASLLAIAGIAAAVI
jgi:hypothetical protein